MRVGQIRVSWRKARAPLTHALVSFSEYRTVRCYSLFRCFPPTRLQTGLHSTLYAYMYMYGIRAFLAYCAKNTAWQLAGSWQLAWGYTAYGHGTWHRKHLNTAFGLSS